MRDDAPNVARFQAIHIGSRSVHFLADVVAGAMHEILGESGFTDDLARGAIDLPTFDGAAGADIFLHVLYGGIACLADNGENLGILFGYLVAKKSSPGNVVVNAVGSEGFGPDVEQQQIAPLYCGRTLRQWLVCGSPECGPTATIGGESESTPRARNWLTIHCCRSNS